MGKLRPGGTHTELLKPETCMLGQRECITHGCSTECSVLIWEEADELANMASRTRF